MIDNYTVYKHISPSGKIYIGITKQKPEKRFLSGYGYHQTPHFWNAIQKYGWNNFEHIILFEGLSKEEAENKEKELIKKYNSTNPKYGYNISLGGETGAKHNEETKSIISHKLKEYYSKEENKEKLRKRQTGKYLSEETKRKMSETHKKIVTDEFRQKCSERLKGNAYWNGKKRILSEETKLKISISKKNKHYGGIGKTPTKIKCIETGEIFDSYKTLQEIKGYSFQNIYACCNGKRKSAYGYKWEFVQVPI